MWHGLAASPKPIPHSYCPPTLTSSPPAKLTHPDPTCLSCFISLHSSIIYPSDSYSISLLPSCSFFLSLVFLYPTPYVFLLSLSLPPIPSHASLGSTSETDLINMIDVNYVLWHQS